MTLTSKHKIFHPSAAHRWFNCPGSATLEASVPDKPASIYAIEGSAAHELCRYFGMMSATRHDINQLIGAKVGKLVPVTAFNPDDFEYPEEIEQIRDTLIDPQMASAVWMYCDYVYKLLGNTSPLNREIVRFEEKVETRAGVAGTADCILSDWPCTLHVIDFKYGAGISVDPFENLQLLSYALGAYESLEDDDFDEVQITIVQPRDKFSEFIKTWSLPLMDLKTLWFRKVQHAVTTALEKPTLYKVGSWCRWCKGSEICPKVSSTSASITKSAKGARVPTEVRKLQKLLQAESAVLEYFNKAKLEAFNRLSRGEAVPSFKLVQSFGNTKWLPGAEEYIKTYAWDHRIYTEKLMTPNQAKTVLKELEVETDWISKKTHRPAKGLVLVPDTDRRPAYSSAQQDFEDDDYV